MFITSKFDFWLTDKWSYKIFIKENSYVDW